MHPIFLKTSILPSSSGRSLFPVICLSKLRLRWLCSLSVLRPHFCLTHPGLTPGLLHTLKSHTRSTRTSPPSAFHCRLRRLSLVDRTPFESEFTYLLELASTTTNILIRTPGFAGQSQCFKNSGPLSRKLHCIAFCETLSRKLSPVYLPIHDTPQSALIVKFGIPVYKQFETYTSSDSSPSGTSLSDGTQSRPIRFNVVLRRENLSEPSLTLSDTSFQR